MATNIIEVFSVSHAAILDGTTGAEEAAGDIYGVRSASLAADMGNYDNTGDDSILGAWYWLNFATLTVEGGFLPLPLMALLSGSTITTSGAATKAVAKFTPAAVGATDAFDYSGAAAIAFTVNDGSGATIVTLDADYTNLAGVVAAVDADLGAGYAVTASTTFVQIEAAAAGEKTIYFGGTDAADVTGSAGYVNTAGTAGDTDSLPLWDEDSVNQSTKPALIRSPAKDSGGVARELDIILYKVQFAPFNFTGPAYKTGLLVNYTGKVLMSDVDETGTALAKRGFGRLLSKPAS